MLSTETEIRPNLVERISPRDKEVLLLAPTFFWAKYERRKISIDGFELAVPEYDNNDPLSILKAGFDMRKQANADIEGEAAGVISSALIKHPNRNELFPNLKDIQIRTICGELEEIFENQEFCAECESWSYYEANPEDFPIDVAAVMLFFKGEEVGLPWFAEMQKFKERQTIIKSVIKEKMAKGVVTKLLSDKH